MRQTARGEDNDMVTAGMVLAGVMVLLIGLRATRRRRVPAQSAITQRVVARQAEPAATSSALRSSGGTCHAATLIGDRLLWASHAPRLPLADCKRTDCRCCYEGVEDQRHGDRREVVDRRDAIRLSDGRRLSDRRSAKASWDETH
jgi:hypothetical protein